MENNEQDKNQIIKTNRADQIINEHIGFSMVAGAIPIPFLDIAAVTAIEVDMIHQLSLLHKVNWDLNLGKSVVSSLLSASLGIYLGWAATSAVKTIPGVGTIIGISAQVILAGATTYALGKIFDLHFSNEGTLENFDFDKMKDTFQDFFTQGEKIAKKQQEEMKKEDPLDRLKKLTELQKMGAITEEEFEKAKQSILKDI